MKKYTTVVFDMDGTVLNTLDDLTESVNYALSKFDMPLKTKKEVRSFLGNGNLRLMQLSVPNGNDNAKFEEVYDCFKEYYVVHCNDKSKPYDGILELMKDLENKGYKMAIVSNKYDEAVKELNSKYFAKYVSVAVGDREGKKKKPAPDLVEVALEELGSSKAESIYIGDSEVDMATAKNSNLDCITVTWGFRDKDYLIENGATIIADKPEDISNIL